ncbi:MAG: hypothetical protein ABI268_01575 [Rhodanobacter sp.]
MHVVLTIKESKHGLWCIWRGSAAIYDNLSYPHAIRLGRALAREEHARSGISVSVEMVSTEFIIELIRFGEMTRSRTAA